MSENSSKIGKYQFVAEPFHVDFTGRLTMVVDVIRLTVEVMAKFSQMKSDDNKKD